MSICCKKGCLGVRRQDAVAGGKDFLLRRNIMIVKEFRYTIGMSTYDFCAPLMYRSSDIAANTAGTKTIRL